MSSSNKNKSRVKGILNLVLVIIGIAFFVVLFLFKGSMNDLVSKKMAEQAGAETRKTIDQKVDSAFNYQKNGKPFRITFLEFGATGCIACLKMETVMKQVREKYHETVNVVFYNVLLPQNQDFMKYYGIAAIPTQVLLDKDGKEVFRHTGYLSFDDLDKEFHRVK